MDLLTAINIFNDAIELCKNKEYIEAKNLLLKISNNSDELIEIYAKAQKQLGLAYSQLSETNLEIEAYQRVPFNCIAEYSEAQFLSGITYSSMNENELALEYLKKVPKSVESFYMRSQYHMGIIYRSQNKYDLAIDTLQNISKIFMLNLNIY